MNSHHANQDDERSRCEQIRDLEALLTRLELDLAGIQYHLIRLERSFQGITPALRKRISNIGSGALFSAENWRSFLPNVAANMLTAAFAIVVGWYWIEQTYLRERTVAAPVLSVEYAYFSTVGSVDKEPISKLVYQLSQFEQYNKFVLKSMGLHDLRRIDAMSDKIGAGDAKILLDIVSLYRNFLSEIKATLSDDIDASGSLGNAELRMKGRAILDSIEGMGEDDIRAKVIADVHDRQKEIDHLLVVLDSVERLLDNVNEQVFVKLSILNRGARDGLIRPRGYIQYSGGCYAMIRVEAPPRDEQPMAVPTYVVNDEAGAVTQTVGKIDSDTMAQYWFEVRNILKRENCEGLKENALSTEIINDSVRPESCEEGEEAIAYLFDQDGNATSDQVPCSGPIL